jgi:hypothetical protein
LGWEWGEEQLKEICIGLLEGMNRRCGLQKKIMIRHHPRVIDSQMEVGVEGITGLGDLREGRAGLAANPHIRNLRTAMVIFKGMVLGVAAVIKGNWSREQALGHHPLPMVP